MKLILSLLAALALPATLCGQGQVNFQNTGPNPIAGTAGTLLTTNSFGPASGGGIRGFNAFRIGLYIAPDGTVDESLFVLTVVATNSPLLVGRFSYPGGVVTIPDNNGTPIAYQVRAWVLTSGQSYEAAVWSWSLIGVSGIGQITPAVGGGPPPTVFGPGPGGSPDFPGQLNSGFTLYFPPIPEPSTYALAALGILMFFCYRKKARCDN